MSSFRRFTIGLCLVMISMVGIVETGNRQSVPPPESLGPNDVMPIFEMLREGGDRTLAEANEEKKRKHEERKRENPKLKSEFYPYRQYIVAIVVSREEIEDVRKTSKEGRDSFYELLQKEGRHVFQINERSKEKPPCAEEPCGKRPNYPWHGEVIAIHKQRFDKAIKQFLDKQKGKHPILLLYSHYIPCAKLPSTFGYSCSEELATFKKKNRNLKMFVAFSRYFFQTDGRAAHDFMKNGGITAFQNMVRSYRVFLPGSIDNQYGPFHQNELFQCLSELPLTMCCMGEPNRESITAFFVNSITFTCWNDVVGRVGLPTDKLKYLECASTYIETHIRDDCRVCSSKAPENLQATIEIVVRCVEHALSVVSKFGQPQPPAYDPYSPKWVEPNGTPYPAGANPNEQKNIKRVSCADRKLSIDSLCTKMEESELPVATLIRPGWIRNVANRVRGLVRERLPRFDGVWGWVRARLPRFAGV